MNSKRAPPLMIFMSSLAILSLVAAQDRAPHGLAYENPMAFPPAAYDFFHPDGHQATRNKPCGGSSSCSPLPMAAQVAKAKESREGPDSGRNRIGAGAVTSIVIGIATVAILAMTVYRVIATRRANAHRSDPVKTEA
ncbi:hypothetical protein MLD38_017291 [Melastoma candidum]|uniref:Uncharacterized protein n=1 Tax=Melastoma candidum TaxID=119954 RepID=A0ACB9QPC8_9MYRT|nr:hypothetical protein MLD38_017291 [Melastoma candidum]